MEETEFSLQLQMLGALVFIPPQDVVRGFAVVCNKIMRNFAYVLEELLVYFEDT